MKRSIILTALLAPHLTCAATYYVDASRPSDAGDGLSWATAKQTIQAAVDLAADGDIVLVTNGLYAIGGRGMTWYSSFSNRVVITKNITVRSINGPAATIIRGQRPLGPSAVRCVYMSAGLLTGFTLTNGFAFRSAGYPSDGDCAGGCLMDGNAAISNCTISGNSAQWAGGGTYGGTVINCTISGNSALNGGGTRESTVNNCTISGNSALSGGGTSRSTVNNCTISGNTADEEGGGTYGGTVMNCTISGNSAFEYGGGSAESTLTMCVLVSNDAYQGGAVYRGMASFSTIHANIAAYGGGSFAAVLNSCTITANRADFEGGGSLGAIVSNSLVAGNSARYGGGTYWAKLHRCTIRGNFADYEGGGVSFGSAYNSLIISNHASSGGGVYGGNHFNCTLARNTAAISGGGARAATLKNCIIWDNTAPLSNNYYAGSFEYSCTTPSPGGPGTISLNPLFAGPHDFRLIEGSPCINAGSNAYAPVPFDLDGNPRIYDGTIDMGCYEFVPEPAAGLLLLVVLFCVRQRP